jgi:hypothetical protein
MYNLRTVPLLLLWLFPLSNLVQAQHSLATLSLVERVVKEKETTCGLVSAFVRKSQEENYAFLTWKCGEQEVRVDVNEYGSVEDAEITPNSLMTADPRGRTLLKSIGDEAYLLGEGLYVKGRFNVIFRKGKVRMNVTAQSSTVAQRFAKLFADSLPAAQQVVIQAKAFGVRCSRPLRRS